MNIKMLVVVSALLLTCFTALPAQAQTFDFQQGADGYTGTFTIMISEYEYEMTILSSDTSDDRLSVDLEDDEFRLQETQVLLRFDDIVGGAAIPPGAAIARAEVELWTVSSSDGTVTIGTLDRAFNGASTWNSMGDGAQTTSILDSITGLADSSYVSFDVTSDVQSVVDDGEETNYGWAFKIDSDDGWDFCSELPDCDGDSEVSYTLKPRLTVMLASPGRQGEPVPTMSTGALLLLLVMVALFGLGVLRRRVSD